MSTYHAGLSSGLGRLWLALLLVLFLVGCGPTPSATRPANARPSSVATTPSATRKRGSPALPTLGSVKGLNQPEGAAVGPATLTPHPYLVRPANWPTDWPWPPDRKAIDALKQTPSPVHNKGLTPAYPP